MRKGIFPCNGRPRQALGKAQADAPRTGAEIAQKTAGALGQDQVPQVREALHPGGAGEAEGDGETSQAGEARRGEGEEGEGRKRKKEKWHEGKVEIPRREINYHAKKRF